MREIVATTAVDIVPSAGAGFGFITGLELGLGLGEGHRSAADEDDQESRCESHGDTRSWLESDSGVCSDIYFADEE